MTAIVFTSRLAALLRRTTASAAMLLIATPGIVHANPQGGVVSAGQASIAAQDNILTVKQQSGRAVIDWRSFNIDPNETTRFEQPNSNSVTLNRVGGTGSSQIFGTLTANGNVVIVNPNGVVFAKGSHVDVNGLVATTADIDNAAFMNGSMTFNKPGDPDAAIINEGTITAKDAGLVGLVAPNVVNNGVITARMGRVQLSSGDTATVDLYGDKLMEVAVSDDVKEQLVRNTGTIDASGGSIAMTAAAGRNVVDSLVDVQGELKAPTVSQKNGAIYIGEDDGAANNGDRAGHDVIVQARLDASGHGQNDTGGTIGIFGNHVTVKSGSAIDASGTKGGGTIRIGGGRKGAEGFTGSNKTAVEHGAVINADASTGGDGGKVTVWSDRDTSYDGTISVKGDNGGDVEVSGKHVLDFTGTVDLTAFNGTAGTLLLDPENITIQASAGTPAITCSSGSCTATSDSSILTVSNLQSALASGNVIVSTGSMGSQTGNITVADNVTWSTGNLLTLSAAGSITINSGVTVSNTYTGSTFGAGAVPVVLALRADSGGVNGSATAGGSSYGVINNGTINLSGSTGAASIFYDWNGTYTPGTLTTNGSWAAPTNATLGSQITAYKLINSFSDFQAISTDATTLGGTYALGKSIDGASSIYNESTLGFTGLIDGQFCGLIGGSYCGISNFSINSSALQYAGLLHDMSGNSVVRNLSLNNLTLSSTASTGQGGLLAGNIASNAAIANVTVSGTISHAASGNGTYYIGGLVGNASGGTIINSASSATVTDTGSGSTSLGARSIGGLVGNMSGAASITSSYSTGTVNYIFASSSTGSYVYLGGLVGNNVSTATRAIKNSYATGNISATYSTTACSGGPCSGPSTNVRMGGLVGLNGSASNTSISQVYATGNLYTNLYAGGSSAGYMGGLVGLNLTTSSNGIVDAYATGSVTYTRGSSNTFLGGLVGLNGSSGVGTINGAYSTGYISAGYGTAGGLVASNAGSVNNSYWDTQTSGLSTSAGGSGATGLSTASLQSTLQSGLGSTNWGIGTGLYPYLKWQFPTGTPQALSGIAYGAGDPESGGSSPLTGASVATLISGASVIPWNGSGGVVSTGANGYYYILLSPNTLSSTSALTYLTGGTKSNAFADSVSSTTSGMDLFANTFYAKAANQTAFSGITSDMATALGANSGGNFLFSLSSGALTGSNNANIYINSGAASLAIDKALSTSGTSATLGIKTAGNLTQTQAITASGLSLSGSGTTYTLSNNSNNIGTFAANVGTASLTVNNGAHNLSVGSLNSINGITAGTFSLNDTATVTQTQAINATSALFQGSGGIFTLDGTTNNIGTLAATIGAGNLTLNNGANNLSIGSVGGVNGITAGSVTLTDTGTVSETLPIAATNLLLKGSGATYTLNSGNTIGTVAASIGAGTLNLNNSTHNIVVGSVGGINGITAATVTLTGSSGGTWTQNQAINATTLSLSGSGGIFNLNGIANVVTKLAASVGTGSVTLDNGANALSLGNGSALVAGTLNLTDSGTVTQTQAITAANASFAGSGGTYTLSSDNHIGTVSANLGTGTLTLNNGANNLAIGSVNNLDGITAATVALTGTGTVTQTQGIAAGNLLLQGSGATYTLTNSGNNVGTLAANVGSGSIAFGNGANALTIGSINATSGITATTLELTGSSTVTQTAAMTVGNLALLGGGAYTLSNASNSIGTLAGDSGALSLVNSGTLNIGTVGATSGVTATGNVALTAQVLGMSQGITATGRSVTLNTADGMALGNINAGSIFARTTGATADIAINNGAALTATGTGDAITLAASRNFINDADASALSAGNGRWLVYSTRTADNVFNGLAGGFNRYSCTYGGSCTPAIPTAGNGFIYSYTPILTVTPHAAVVYGNAATMAGYSYLLSGYLTGDSAGDTITGSLTGTSSYALNDSVGNYNLDYASGTLTSAEGYGFNYNSSATGLSVTPRPLTVTTDNKTKATTADPNPAFTGSSTLTAHDANLVSFLYAPQGYTGAVGTYTVAATATDPSSRLANYTRTNAYGTFTVLGNAPPPAPVQEAIPVIPNTVTLVSQLGTNIIVGTGIPTSGLSASSSATGSMPLFSPASSTPAWSMRDGAGASTVDKSLHFMRGILEIDPSLSKEINIGDIASH